LNYRLFYSNYLFVDKKQSVQAVKRNETVSNQ